MKRFFIIFLLFFCYISLTATKACQEDYVVFKSSPTATPTPEEEDDTPTPTPSPTGTITITITPTLTPTFIDDDNIDDDDDFIDDDDEDLDDLNFRSGFKMKDLLNDLEQLSEGESSNWLGEAFADKDNNSDRDNIDEEDDEAVSYFIDSDNDGYSDALELENDTDPNSNTSFPYIAKTRLYDRINQKDINDFLSSSYENLDNDADGLPDSFENLLGTDSALKDTDGDGISDLKEYQNGTDPAKSDF